jgi:hypothetical protein
MSSTFDYQRNQDVKRDRVRWARTIAPTQQPAPSTQCLFRMILKKTKQHEPYKGAARFARATALKSSREGPPIIRVDTSRRQGSALRNTPKCLSRPQWQTAGMFLPIRGVLTHEIMLNYPSTELVLDLPPHDPAHQSPPCNVYDVHSRRRRASKITLVTPILNT